MFELDLSSKKSIHESIVDGVKSMIIDGELKVNEKLPSVRDLSAQLTVNPNTIAKAFKSLEAQGWIYTIAGKGCFISGEKQAPDFARTNKIYEAMADSIRELRYMGISETEIVNQLEKLFRKGGAEK